MVDNTTRVMKALEGIEKATQAMAASGKIMAQASAKLQHPVYQGKDIPDVAVSEDDISTSISLGGPDIETTTTIYRQNDGFVRIEILIEPPESERLMELIDQLPVNQFSLQAVESD